MYSLLFIGGAADGKFISVPHDHLVYSFLVRDRGTATPDLNSPCECMRHDYIKQKIRGELRGFYIMLFDGLSVDDMFKQLIRGYSPDLCDVAIDEGQDRSVPRNIKQ